MDVGNLIPFVFTAVGVFLLGRSYLIGVRKKINLISGLDEKTLKRVRDKEKLCKDYSKALVIMACACFSATPFLVYVGTVGKIIGLALIIISSINLSRITLDMNTKIKKRIY